MGMKPFSIEEAEDYLPTVTRLLRKAQRLRDKIIVVLEANEVVLEVSSEEGFHFFLTENIKVNKEFHKLYYQFYKTMGQISDRGCVVDDLDEGIISFPFSWNNEPAFLSWQLGEDKIRYWYNANEGFECRRRIVDIDELYCYSKRKAKNL